MVGAWKKRRTRAQEGSAIKRAPTGMPERREGSRRKVITNRGPLGPLIEPNDRPLFPASWPYLIAAVVISIAGSSLMVMRFPEPLAACMFGFSLIALLGANLLQPYVHERNSGGRWIGTISFVIAPLALFGAAMTNWVLSGTLGWDSALASMLLVSGISAAYLRQHPGVMLAGQIAIWFWAVLVHATIPGFVALLVTVLVALLTSVEQFRIDARDDREREALDRLQMRASEILSDYEETRQGWFWETDRRGELTYVSAPIAKMMGVSPQQLTGKPLTCLFDLDATGEEGQRTLDFHLRSRSAFSELPLRAAIKDRELWWSISGRAYFDNFDNFIGYRGSGTDLTEKRRSQQHASRLARFDSLTGLANRHQMSQTLEKLLGAQQEANRACTIMLLDLDRFKRVNDTMGHPAGDALLKKVAKRLQNAVGKMGQVGRLGGDEFEVIVPGRVDKDKIEALADTIIQSLSKPYGIEGKRVVIGASIGISRVPDDGLSSDVLIRNADLALYAAKDAGRGRYHFFAKDMHVDAEARAQLENDLRDAIARQELSLNYQPVVDVATETITGFEALLRWQHKEHGWISPERFVSIAEDTGLITKIGDWVLHQACRDLASWPLKVRVAVNVSPLQFANPNFPAQVESAINQARIEPSRLELEITESVFLSEDEGVEAMFAALKRIGVRLALDDFGTGYSSLGYLKRAPFDKIKIDRSFIRGMTEAKSRNGAIIASITGLAHALGMETIAEGVETMDELDLVRMFGCSHVQGFIYERPLTSKGARARLQTGLSTIARGQRQTRQPRQLHQQRVVLLHKGEQYQASIRNISLSGALLEGLWNVPVGTRFDLALSDGEFVGCTVRWCEANRIGVEFAAPLKRDADGRISALEHAPNGRSDPSRVRKAG